MSDSRELGDLLLSLYRAARETPLCEFQDAALELVKPLIRFDSAQWGSGSQNPEWISKRHVHLHRDSPNAAEVYEDVKEQDDAVKLAWKRKNGVFSYNVAEFMRGRSRAGIREYAKRVEHENVLLSFNIDTQNAFTKWISLYRANANKQFTGVDGKFAKLLVPHLWEALAINRVTHLEHLNTSGIERRFELGICDKEGRILHSESGFRLLVTEQFGAGSIHRLPAQCVNGLLHAGRFRGCEAIIEVAQQADVLFLKARKLRKSDQLSPREWQIAIEVARGRSHKEVAERFSIAPATVRNHIQAIHEKLGVHNAAELASEIKDGS